MSVTSSLFCSLFTLSCGSPLELTPITYDQLAGWQQDTHQEALVAFKHSCSKLYSTKNKASLANNARFGALSHWKKACQQAQYYQKDTTAKQFFERYFTPYQINNGKEGLFTGYYEIGLHGSLTPSKRYYYPLYAKPKGTVSYTRKQIDEGALKGNHLEFVWVDSQIDAFFLHIQGSGRIYLDNGTVMHVRFDGRNNYKYRSIGAYMRDTKLLEEVTAPTIKQWLQNHPEQVANILHQNPSYIFFKETKSNAVKGAQNVPLIPERSVAIDPKHFAYGLPLWIDTTYPDTNTKLQKLMVAQDTGSAIKGTVRADIFFGFGKQAEHYAGLMKQKGTMTVLLPKK